MRKIILQTEDNARDGVFYEVDPSAKPLGSGGMGRVIPGIRVDEKTNTCIPVAVKFLYEDLSVKSLVRAKNEASIRIEHDNLLRMYDFVEIPERISNNRVRTRCHVVSELLEGVTLSELMSGYVTDRKGVTIPYAEKLHHLYIADRRSFALLIAKKVVYGLMALHDQGYIHRDIDPSNVMVTSDGKIKLIDFGIAKKLKDIGVDDKQVTEVGQFVGKHTFAAPEQLLGDIKSLSVATDVYAVGILLYYIIVGETPFENVKNDVIKVHLKNKIPLNRIPYRDLQKIIRRATSKQPSDRYSSMAEFMVAMEKAEVKKKNRIIEYIQRFSLHFNMNYNRIPAWMVFVVVFLITLVVGLLFVLFKHNML